MFISLWLIAVSIVLTLRLWSRHKKLRKFARKFDGPRGVPVVGILPKFLGKNNEEILNYILELMKQYETPVKVWIGPMLVLLIDKPEQLKTVLNSRNCLNKPYVYKFLDVNFGLMSGPGKCAHAQLRDLIAHLPAPLASFPSYQHQCGSCIGNT